jgi:acyl phosphate:glycerol-3-phosphate acyltransferase
MNWISLISIPIAYLLGSISSASIIAGVFGKIDIRDEPDGRISAAAVYRRVGRLAFVTVVAMDIGKAALAVLIAQWLSADPVIVMLAGVFAIAGHQWSPFIKFQGGLGATTIGGVLVSVATFPTFVGAAVAIIATLATRKSTISFGLGVFSITLFLLLMKLFHFTMPPILIASPLTSASPCNYYLLTAYPLILSLMMIAKATQIKYKPGAKRK